VSSTSRPPRLRRAIDERLGRHSRLLPRKRFDFSPSDQTDDDRLTRG
jgi:hypothetical protein